MDPFTIALLVAGSILVGGLVIAGVSALYRLFNKGYSPVEVTINYDSDDENSGVRTNDLYEEKKNSLISSLVNLIKIKLNNENVNVNNKDIEDILKPVKTQLAFKLDGEGGRELSLKKMVDLSETLKIDGIDVQFKLFLPAGLTGTQISQTIAAKDTIVEKIPDGVKVVTL